LYVTSGDDGEVYNTGWGERGGRLDHTCSSFLDSIIAVINMIFIEFEQEDEKTHEIS
jgi:hypothetical protein